MVSVLALAFLVVAGGAFAALTFTATTTSSDGALTISSATTNAISLDSGTTGAVNLGTGNNAKTISIGTGTAGNTINVGTDNTTLDAINVGSALDTVIITGTSAGLSKIELAATRPTGATSSYQTLAGDLNYVGAAGGTGTYHAGVMGNFLGDTLTNANATIHAGTIGKYSVTTSDALVGPKAGLVGEAETSVANAAVMAVLGGDTATVAPGAAYAVRYLNSTAASKFTYGLDLFSAAVGGYKAVDYGTADIRLQNGETISNATDGAITISGALTGTPAVLSTTTAGGGSNLKLQYKQITNALTGDYEGLHVRVSTDVGSADNAVNGAQIKAVANDVASQIDVEILRGVYTSVDAKDNLVTTARAFEASLDGLPGSTITEAVGIELMNNSSGAQTNSYGLSINGGTASGHKAYTRDIRLQNGELIDNATDGTIAFSGIIAANGGLVQRYTTNANVPNASGQNVIRLNALAADFATIAGGTAGQIITIIFSDAVVVTDDNANGANAINLVGSANLTSAADDVLELVFDGTSWFEVSRSVNN